MLETLKELKPNRGCNFNGYMVVKSVAAGPPPSAVVEWVIIDDSGMPHLPIEERVSVEHNRFQKMEEIIGHGFGSSSDEVRTEPGQAHCAVDRLEGKGSVTWEARCGCDTIEEDVAALELSKMGMLVPARLVRSRGQKSTLAAIRNSMDAFRSKYLNKRRSKPGPAHVRRVGAAIQHECQTLPHALQKTSIASFGAALAGWMAAVAEQPPKRQRPEEEDDCCPGLECAQQMNKQQRCVPTGPRIMEGVPGLGAISHTWEDVPGAAPSIAFADVATTAEERLKRAAEMLEACDCGDTRGRLCRRGGGGRAGTNRLRCVMIFPVDSQLVQFLGTAPRNMCKLGVIGLSASDPRGASARCCQLFQPAMVIQANLLAAALKESLGGAAGVQCVVDNAVLASFAAAVSVHLEPQQRYSELHLAVESVASPIVLDLEQRAHCEQSSEGCRLFCDDQMGLGRLLLISPDLQEEAEAAEAAAEADQFDAAAAEAAKAAATAAKGAAALLTPVLTSRWRDVNGAFSSTLASDGGLVMLPQFLPVGFGHQEVHRMNMLASITLSQCAAAYKSSGEETFGVNTFVNVFTEAKRARTGGGE
ncbi:MAG TPA: hypothetical protein EYQ83_02885 [Acidobacteria bacterium]|nr:hypothetical protein [Acidobacteriota bacterium]